MLKKFVTSASASTGNFEFGKRSSLQGVGREAHCDQTENYLPDFDEVCRCEPLQSVPFGWSSPLKWIGIQAFSKSSLIQVHKEELCDQCFYNCKCLSRVTFGEPSAVKRIGVGAFHYRCQPILKISSHILMSLPLEIEFPKQFLFKIVPRARYLFPVSNPSPKE